MKVSELPKYHDLMAPTFVALEKIGGSGSLNEISDAVVEHLKLPPTALDVWYNSGAGAVLPARLSWARSYLKTAGYLASGGRGIWLLTDAGRAALGISDSELKRNVSKAVKAEIESKKQQVQLTNGDRLPDPEEDSLDWKDRLLKLLKTIEPTAFERLSQRLLRESGFVKVEVTGRAGDGGIDGTGILQLSLMSFHILFQCKRYQGSVGSGAVRDFRGAMMGRTDKGLIITTGTFSPDARREATRDGAPPIDLIDGIALCEKLKELSLGVETRLVEEVSVNPSWFAQL